MTQKKERKIISEKKKREKTKKNTKNKKQAVRIRPMLGNSNNKDFLNKAPPPGYVPGLGRGATGFTTQSDIGSAYDGPMDPGGLDGDDNDGLRSNEYDEFNGGDAGLFVTATNDKDDKEADDIYAAVDRYMDSRRRRQREAKERALQRERREALPSIQQQFSGVKRELASLSLEDWESIPDASQTQTRARKRKAASAAAGIGRYTPVPDSVIMQAHADSSSSTTAVEVDDDNDGSGVAAESARAMGSTKAKLLELKLSGYSSSVGGQTAVDPAGYLTGLNTQGGVLAAGEVGDVKKTRLLLKSVRTTNPGNPSAWIGSARLEEYAGQLAQARRIIAEGVRACPEAEDVWLEAARLHGRDTARGLLAEGVRRLPRSVALWLRAAELEDTDARKRLVLRKALEYAPGSVQLWKAAVRLESAENARVLFARAVECVPHSVDMWLALARLETYENAKRTLNSAVAHLPNEPLIWINAARLEESSAGKLSETSETASTSNNDKSLIKAEPSDNSKGSSDNAAPAASVLSRVRAILRKGLRVLAQNKVKIDREFWLREARNAEAAGAPATCRAIVDLVAGEGLAPSELRRQWEADAERMLHEFHSVEVARALYAHALEAFPRDDTLWLQLAFLEKAHGGPAAVVATLERGIAACPHAEALWLMLAKERWLTGHDVPGARSTLQQAFAQNPESEDIWLAAVKLESEIGEKQRAQKLLANARVHCPSERVWRRSALLERELANTTCERELLDTALAKFPAAPKLWALRCALAERTEGSAAARSLYQRATRACPTNVHLWTLAARSELSGDAENVSGGSTVPASASAAARARSLLEKARKLVPKSPELWLEAVRVERKAGGGLAYAQTLLAKALQECPKAGPLWAEFVEHGPATATTKSRATTALRNCENDPFVIVAVTKMTFWADRKMEKAREWLEKAVQLRPDVGDFWAALYKFELQASVSSSPSSLASSSSSSSSSSSAPAGSEQQSTSRVKAVIERCAAAAPTHGDAWRPVFKAPENKGLSTEQLLKKVSLILD